jgi:hypothetical protein
MREMFLNTGLQSMIFAEEVVLRVTSKPEQRISQEKKPSKSKTDLFYYSTLLKFFKIFLQELFASFFSMLRINSPTLAKLWISFCLNSIPNSSSMAINRLICESESQPSMSSAVISMESTMFSSSKTLRNTLVKRSVIYIFIPPWWKGRPGRGLRKSLSTPGAGSCRSGSWGCVR